MKNFLLLSILFGGIMIGGCKKNSSNNNDSTGGVYAVGYVENNGWQVATLWQNGKEQPLSGSYASTNIVAKSVFVYGKDVYVAGDSIVYDNTNLGNPTSYAVYWKNGTRKVLGDANSHANSIYVANDKAYIVGEYLYQGKKRAALWLSSTTIVQSLPDGNFETSANSVYVSGSNIYVAGKTSRILGYNTGALWTNGTLSIIGDPGKGANTNAVFGENNNVYMVGNDRLYSTNSPSYWYVKTAGNNNNGVLFSLPMLGATTECTNGFLSDDIVYACGYKYANSVSNGVVWGIGEPVVLSDASKLWSIFVVRKDIYVGGNESSNSKPAIWKNSTIQILNNTNKGTVYGVFVK